MGSIHHCRNPILLGKPSDLPRRKLLPVGIGGTGKKDHLGFSRMDLPANGFHSFLHSGVLTHGDSELADG
jgi:hypothetical protein